jgi:hypothetical protein
MKKKYGMARPKLSKSMQAFKAKETKIIKPPKNKGIKKQNKDDEKEIK